MNMPAIQWLWHSSGSIQCKHWPFDRILIRWNWIFHFQRYTREWNSLQNSTQFSGFIYNN